MNKPVPVVDARGLLCPWPVLRLSRAARAMGGRGRVRIIADDPVASKALAELCAERGWAFAADPLKESTFDIMFG